MNPKAQSFIDRLGLQPHPEGGWYAEVFRSGQEVQRSDQRRRALTLIDFLLAEGDFSRWHVVASDEVWHFYEGSPLELVVYDPVTERLEAVKLGPLDEPGCVRHHVVPKSWWQMARPLSVFSLVGCTVAPGFEFEDFRFVAALPDHRRHFETKLTGYERFL